MATNLRFNFLYRDSGNYKKFGHKDYSNPNNLTLEETETQLRECLISEEFFYPEHAGIPKLPFHRYLDDNSWYEFENIERVKSKKCKESFNDLLVCLKTSKLLYPYYW